MIASWEAIGMWASVAETVHISVVLPADRLRLGVEVQRSASFSRRSATSVSASRCGRRFQRNCLQLAPG